MDDAAIARAIHVAAVVFWIGGVAFVTTVLLPIVRQQEPAKRMALFHALEQSFARQARVTTLLAGLSGLYMLFRLDLWDRFLSARFWWMHAMVVVWLLFTAMLFITHPLRLDRRLLAARGGPQAAFARLERLHRILLALSAITILGAVAGSHGLLFG